MNSSSQTTFDLLFGKSKQTLNEFNIVTKWLQSLQEIEKEIYKTSVLSSFYNSNSNSINSNDPNDPKNQIFNVLPPTLYLWSPKQKKYITSETWNPNELTKKFMSTMFWNTDTSFQRTFTQIQSNFHANITQHKLNIGKYYIRLDLSVNKKEAKERVNTLLKEWIASLYPVTKTSLQEESGLQEKPGYQKFFLFVLYLYLLSLYEKHEIKRENKRRQQRQKLQKSIQSNFSPPVDTFPQLKLSIKEKLTYVVKELETLHTNLIDRNKRSCVIDIHHMKSKTWDDINKELLKYAERFKKLTDRSKYVWDPVTKTFAQTTARYYGINLPNRD